MKNELSQAILKTILNNFLGVTFWESFYIKSKDRYEIDPSAKECLGWIEVCVDDYGNVRFCPNYDKTTNDFVLNHDGEVVCSVNVDDKDDDFFWRVTLGNLLAGNFFIRKKPDITSIKATINFLRSQGVKEIIITRHPEDKEKIYYYLLDSHRITISNDITKLQNCFLYKAISDVLLYYNIELRENEQRTSFILEEENFDF